MNFGLMNGFYFGIEWGGFDLSMEACMEFLFFTSTWIGPGPGVGFVHNMHDCITLEFDFYMPSEVLNYSDSILSFE